MKYFTIEELSRSETARRRNIANVPAAEAVQALTALAENVLDPLREAYGKPVRVTSGYRSLRLNKAVGGAKNSDHLYGRAADITGTPGTKEENRKLFDLAQELRLPYKQLIDEKGYSWVHVSYDAADIRRQTLHL